jgi:hypothetical protein
MASYRPYSLPQAVDLILLFEEYYMMAVKFIVLQAKQNCRSCFVVFNETLLPYARSSLPFISEAIPNTHDLYTSV